MAAEAVAPSRCSRVRETEGEAHPAAVRLLAFRLVPSGQRLSGRPPAWAQSAGMCPGPGPAALNHTDSDILSASPSERPLRGWREGWGDIYERSVHTHAHAGCDSADILSAGLWDGAI